jgi:hypothetical protein
MKSDIKKYIPEQIFKYPLEYLSLGLFFILSAVIFFVFSYDPHSQRRVVYVTAAGYLFWSLFHHYRRGDLHFSIIMEYIILAILAIVVAIFTLA